LTVQHSTSVTRDATPKLEALSLCPILLNS